VEQVAPHKSDHWIVCDICGERNIIGPLIRDKGIVCANCGTVLWVHPDIITRYNAGWTDVPKVPRVSSVTRWLGKPGNMILFLFMAAFVVIITAGLYVAYDMNNAFESVKNGQDYHSPIFGTVTVEYYKNYLEQERQEAERFNTMVAESSNARYRASNPNYHSPGGYPGY
jgi:hypothetical protein